MTGSTDVAANQTYPWPSPDKANRILLAVCTRNRPVMLGQCLASVLKLEIPHDASLDVLVVDNSERQEMRLRNYEVVTALPGGRPVTMQYEPRTGIPFARNRAIAHALELGADALVFLDDDQTVPHDWLTVMERVAREEAADVVKTRTEFVLEGNGRFAEQFADRPPTRPDSSRKRGVRFLATNGVWISSRLFRDMGLRFDEREQFSGGDDTLFFLEAFGWGAMMVETSEAIALEKVPADKQTIGWLLQRSFNGGVGRASTHPGRKTPLYYFFAGLLQALLYSLIALLLVWNPPACLYRLRRAAQSVGLMWGAFGHKTEGYRDTVGK